MLKMNELGIIYVEFLGISVLIGLILLIKSFEKAGLLE
jgi:hypothetical protein